MTSRRPGPFVDRELVGLLRARGQVQDARYFHHGEYADDLHPAYPTILIGDLSEWLGDWRAD